MGIKEKEVTEGTGKMRLVSVQCEICDRQVQIISDHAGVTICAACHWDIVSPNNHD